MKKRKLLVFLYYVATNSACVIGLCMAPVRYIRTFIAGRKIRSIWAGTPIINLAINARSERLLGINAKSLVYSTYFISSDFDYNLSRWYSIPILGKLVPFVVFLWACLCTDRLHFYCDRGLIPSLKPFAFNFAELYVYKLLGIQVFFWTYGADVRSRLKTLTMGEPNCCTQCDNIGMYCVCDENKRRKKIDKLCKLSKAIFSGMGDMFYYTPGSIDNTYFWPVDLEAKHGNKYRPLYPNNSKDKPLRVVHSTNHRMFKGTDYLVKAVDELKNEGIDIKLVLVERVPNNEALKIYRTADLIFDQCLMGNLGYFALEGMAMGKPVMCFIRKPEEYLLHPEECPIINTSVNTLRKDIRYFVDNREELTDVGMKSRQYIEKYFTLEAFAERLKKAYKELGVLK